MTNFFRWCLVAVCACLFSAPPLLAQSSGYIDGRPVAHLRLACHDQGVVLRHGNGPDSCDVYGAREAVVNKEGNTFYLFYDGAGKTAWLSCLAESKDLVHWMKKGPVLQLGAADAPDSKSASAPWVIKEKDTWHMFYLGTPHTTPPPDRIPSFPYLTLKATATSLEGPWKKNYDVHVFPPKENSYYTVTSSPGFIVKSGDEYLQFFSAATQDSLGTRRTLGLARTKDLNASWNIPPKPIFPLKEQIENSSVFFDRETRTWYLFTNHIGIDKDRNEYTDAIWVYWTRDINTWNENNKAVVLDSSNCSWARGAIGMPSVIQSGRRLALLYDACPGNSTSHMHRDIGLAWIDLPIRIKQ